MLTMRNLHAPVCSFTARVESPSTAAADSSACAKLLRLRGSVVLGGTARFRRTYTLPGGMTGLFTVNRPHIHE